MIVKYKKKDKPASDLRNQLENKRTVLKIYPSF